MLIMQTGCNIRAKSRPVDRDGSFGEVGQLQSRTKSECTSNRMVLHSEMIVSLVCLEHILPLPWMPSR